MKEILTSLKEAYKENPREIIECVIFMAFWAVFLWAGLWFAAILEGTV